MNTKQHERLMLLQKEITIPDNLEQLWFDNLKRVLQESNLAKVSIVLLSLIEIQDVTPCYNVHLCSKNPY